MAKTILFLITVSIFTILSTGCEGTSDNTTDSKSDLSSNSKPDLNFNLESSSNSDSKSDSSANSKSDSNVNSNPNSKSDSNSNSKTKILTAIFHAQSSGITYKCGSQRGTVTEDGKFQYEDGQDCTFFNGNYFIQTVSKSELKDGAEIIEDSNSNLSDLAKLLLDRTYYSVRERDDRIITLRFAKKFNEKNELKITALFKDLVGSVDATIEDNILKVPGYGDFIFVSEERNYILFDGNRRMYFSKEKAKHFVKLNK